MNRRYEDVKARLVDLVESVGGVIDVAGKPTHPDSRLPILYPAVTITLGAKSFSTHRATLTLCAEDVQRWLQEVVR